MQRKLKLSAQFITDRDYIHNKLFQNKNCLKNKNIKLQFPFKKCLLLIFIMPNFKFISFPFPICVSIICLMIKNLISIILIVGPNYPQQLPGLNLGNPLFYEHQSNDIHYEQEHLKFVSQISPTVNRSRHLLISLSRY